MTLQVTPFEYTPIHYNEAYEYIERMWKRKLTDHERNLVAFAYNIGRTVEMLDTWTKEGNTNG
jgi:hypothetical protein